MTPRLRTLALALTVATGAGCGNDPTEVLVVVSSDLDVPTALDHVRIEASREGAFEPLVREYDLSKPEYHLPLSLGLLPSVDPRATLHLIVTGAIGTNVIATQVVTTAFLPNQTRTLPVHLGPELHRDGGTDGGDDAKTDGPSASEGGLLNGNGSRCSSASSCASGNCVDGICCNSACTGPCQSCALDVAPGKCTLIAAGAPDPRGICVAQLPTTCGLDGFCDGAGACRKHKAGIACGGESCNGNVYSPPATCDGAGMCRAMPMTCPANNACGPGGCKPVPALSTSALTNTALVGPASTATLVRDACPAGSLVVGFDFSVEMGAIVFVNGVRAHCGVPHVAADGMTVLVDAGATLPWEGPDFTGNLHSLCPSNQAVTGFRSRHGILIDQLAIECAPLTVSATKTVSLGAPTVLTPVGGTGGGTDPMTECPTGMVAGGLITRTSGNLDQFGLACATVTAN